MSDAFGDTGLDEFEDDLLDEGEELTFTFEHPIAMHTLAVGTVELQGRSLTVTDDVRLGGEVTLEDWERLYESGSFHLDDEMEPLGFESGRPVELQLRLRRPIVATFDDAESLLRSLLGDDDSPARHTEAWQALQVTQRLAVPEDPDAWVEIGVVTSFGEAAE